MKPEELRIGNLMQEHYTGKVITVIELTEKSITFTDSFIGKWQAEPILLTEEILIKCGFDLIGNVFRKEPFFVYRPGGPDHGYGLGIKGIGLLTNIQHLHQLQNLYFSLTGEELKIEL